MLKILKTSKEENNSVKAQIRKKERHELVDWYWILKIVVIAFFISVSLSFLCELTLKNTDLFINVVITLFFVFLGVVFDIIGVSVTTADQAIFHSMSARKVSGAKMTVKLIKNASQVSSFCCDVVGDICGVISGCAGISIVALLVSKYEFSLLLTTLVVSGVISALTIGGKAIGKSFAINKSDRIIYEFSKIISIFYKG